MYQITLGSCVGKEFSTQKWRMWKSSGMIYSCRQVARQWRSSQQLSTIRPGRVIPTRYPVPLLSYRPVTRVTPPQWATTHDQPFATSTQRYNSTHQSPPAKSPPKVSPFRGVRQRVGVVLATIGFVSSSVRSVAVNPRLVWDRTAGPLQAIQKFLKRTGLDQEMERRFNRHLASNLVLLHRIASAPANKNEGNENSDPQSFVQSSRRPTSSTKQESASLADQPIDHTFWKQARRYMRYSTAVYGQAMIHAAHVDARGRLDGQLGQEAIEAISQHIRVPSTDIALLDVAYEGDSQHLRHLVAVDHANQSVVLAIRGTFSLQEIVVDVAGFTRPFAGGQAHDGVSTMAERVWEAAGPTVLGLLQAHTNYQLVLTGHSLGAGAASLLTIWLKQQQSLLPDGTVLKCFAYASPPVFAPVQADDAASQVITNFVHHHDAVPFLSLFAIRHLLANLQVVEDYTISRFEKWQVMLGSIPPPANLVDKLSFNDPPTILPGAPRLQVPASKTIWLRPTKEGLYRYEQWDVDTFPSRIRVHPGMLVDHFPARYEYALAHMEENNSEATTTTQ